MNVLEDCALWGSEPSRKLENQAFCLKLPMPRDAFWQLYRASAIHWRRNSHKANIKLTPVQQYIHSAESFLNLSQ